MDTSVERRHREDLLRRAALALAAALVTTAGLAPAKPAGAIPPPPTVLCANDFSTTDLAGWSRSGGRWTVVDGVYRQTRTMGGTTSWYQAEWYAHSATARIKLTAASRRTSFVAFTIAVRGATTSYRLALLAGSVAQLQYVNGGAVTVLASQPLPVNPGTWYTVTLGLSQTTLAVIVDGVWLFNGYVTLPAGGHLLGGVGFSTRNAAGEFDDLSVIHYGPTSEPPCPTTPVTPLS
jgi:hypothetical protein